MAIAQTGAIYKSLNFDGKSSREYGVYITGAAVYNAPERAVEMISIPGRNGAFALDQGRFENITVTYPAGIFADNETDFAEAISDFRNYLCSRSGYCRLTDEYNPDEYRLAIYKSGLEVEPSLLRAGEFNITFECKPQRYLTSGETAVAVSSGDTITNPTLFPARPMIEATGFGDISLNGESISVISTYIGKVLLFNTGKYYSLSKVITIDDQYANPGDDIIFEFAEFIHTWIIDSGTWTSGTASATGNGTTRFDNPFGNSVIMPAVRLMDIVFDYGTARTETTTATYSLVSSAYGSLSGSIMFSITYNGSNAFTVAASVTYPNHVNQYFGTQELDINRISLYSTQTALGSPIYIDLDIGEAYKIENGSAVSVNNAVIMPPEIPNLKPGSNNITFDNSFSLIKIEPRWWKV